MNKWHQIAHRLPEHGQRCIIKEKISGGRIHIFNYPQIWYDDCGFMCHQKVVAWKPVPEHVSINSAGWKSEYRGDDLPDNDCSCLICTEYSLIPQYSYYKKILGRFLGYENVIAFQVLD